MSVNNNMENFSIVYDSNFNSSSKEKIADVVIYGELHGKSGGRAKFWEYVNDIKPKVVLVECVASDVLIMPWNSEMTFGIEKSIEIRGWDDREFVKLLEKKCPNSCELTRLRAEFSLHTNIDEYFRKYKELEPLCAQETKKLNQIAQEMFCLRQQSLMQTTKTFLLKRGGPIAVITGLSHTAFTFFKQIDLDNVKKENDFFATKQTDTTMMLLKPQIESNYEKIKHVPEPHWHLQFRETFKDYRVTVLIDRLYAKHIELLNKWVAYDAYKWSGLAEIEKLGFFNAHSNESIDYPLSQSDIIFFGQVPGNIFDRNKCWEYINSNKPGLVLVEGVTSGVQINPWDTELTAGIEKGIELRGWDDQKFVELCKKELPHSLKLSSLSARYVYGIHAQTRHKSEDPIAISADYFLREQDQLKSLQQNEVEKIIEIGKSTFVQRQKALLKTLITLKTKGPIVVISDYRNVKFTPYGFKNSTYAEKVDIDRLMFFEKTYTTSIMEMMRKEIESYYEKVELSKEPDWKLQFRQAFEDRRVVVLMSRAYRHHTGLLNQWADNMAYYTQS